MWFKRIQLSLIHTAVAITLVPINSTLNRIMINELHISAALVALLVSLPYLFSPLQVAIGSYADQHPLLGRKRTPYIVLGLLLCIGGALLSPIAAYKMADDMVTGLPFGILAFGLWGMGFNFATVSYLTLASELWDEKGRTTTTSLMFFIMILSIIFSAIAMSRLVDPYSPEALYRGFEVLCGAAAVLGTLGLIRLEDVSVGSSTGQSRRSWRQVFAAVSTNSQAKLFFLYLVLLLAAILGQDVLLEPFAARAFDMTVTETTRITSLWGTCVLVMLLLAAWLQRRMSKRVVAQIGALMAMVGFTLIAASGALAQIGMFYGGVILLGLGTGLSTVSNVSLMMDMTATTQTGLFIGAWGMADALARLLGSVLGGALRDVISNQSGDPILGYLFVFVIEGAMLGISLALLQRINVVSFQQSARSGVIEAVGQTGEMTT